MMELKTKVNAGSYTENGKLEGMELNLLRYGFDANEANKVAKKILSVAPTWKN